MVSYDKPVKNLVAGLNATGHVTHTKHRKDMVTVHHNGARLSHEGVLNVWKTRPASAHLDVDGAGKTAQYVELNEYAWACGNTEGNRRSISIEMANSATGGNWPVAEVTWREAARLAGWLFAKVIGARPTNNNFVVHKHWKATTCAGPYIDSVKPKMLQIAQQAYDFFSGAGTPAPAPTPSRKTNAQLAQEVLNGSWGNGDERKRRLESAGYNYAAIQSEVNRRLGSGAPAAHRPTTSEVAREVIAGHWGNGALRRQRLEGAGYNYRQVQNEVNRLL
jgi:Cpl-7 lysozyme-like protein/N-acetylmuramoyl-L-alanine amidase-like protein